jgi:hypothetical protein
LQNLPTGNFFEARILLPKTLLSCGSIGNQTREIINSEEQEFIRKTELQKNQQKYMAVTASVVAVIIFLFQISLFVKSLAR